jgi:hypothetical protein
MKWNRFAPLALAVLAFAAGTARADDLTLSVADKEPPAELAADVRAQLAPKAYTVTTGDGVAFEFWLVPGIQSKSIGATAKETLLAAEPVSVLGAVIASDTEQHDFRDDPIDAGLYVMRLALQPKDGNHMGTAPFDTFAILLPNDRDAQLKGGKDHEAMVKLAQEGTIAKHPPILSLQPIEKAEGEFPRIETNTEHEWDFVYLKLPVEAAGAKGEIVLGLVVRGIGEL